MKKFDGVLKRVRAIEEKNGIRYAKPEGKLYRTLTVLYTLCLIGTLFVNLLFVLGMLLQVSGSSLVMSDVFNYILSVSICTLLIIAGRITLKFKLHITTSIISILPTIFLLSVFAVILKDDIDGFLGLKISYYIRHGIPLGLMLIFMIFITVIALRANIKTDRMYKKVTENLFNMYAIADGETESLSEEQWTEFLESYNPDNYESHAVIASKEDKLEEELNEG